MARTEFDHAARKAARLEPQGFFGWLLTDFPRHLRFARWLDTRTTPEPGGREPTGDCVAELFALATVEPPYLYPIEFQTEPDSQMFGRMLVELGRFWQDHRPDRLPGGRYQLGAAVVNLTGTRASAPASRFFHLPTPDATCGGFVFRERHLQEESAASTLDAIASGKISRVMLVFVPLMEGGGDPTVIGHWEELALSEPDSSRRREYGSLALVMATLKTWEGAWRQALRGWEMRESSVVKEWKQEGKQEGAIETRQQDLKLILEERFGELPPDLRQRIESVANSESLQKAMREAIHITRLEDLSI